MPCHADVLLEEPGILPGWGNQVSPQPSLTRKLCSDGNGSDLDKVAEALDAFGKAEKDFEGMDLIEEVGADLAVGILGFEYMIDGDGQGWRYMPPRSGAAPWFGLWAIPGRICLAPRIRVSGYIIAAGPLPMTTILSASRKNRSTSRTRRS